MHPYEEATRLANEKLEQAESALAAYKGGKEFDPERIRELAHAVVCARRGLLDLHARLWPVRE